MFPWSTRRNPRAAREGGLDIGVVELGLGVFDGRVIGGELSRQLRHQRSLRIELLLGCEIAFGQRLVAVEVTLRVFDVRLILLLLGLRLIESRLEGARVDLGEEVAGMDDLTFVEMEFDDLPIHPRPD